MLPNLLHLAALKNLSTTSDMPKSGVNVTIVMPSVALVRVSPSEINVQQRFLVEPDAMQRLALPFLAAFFVALEGEHAFARLHVAATAPTHDDVVERTRCAAAHHRIGDRVGRVMPVPIPPAAAAGRPARAAVCRACWSPVTPAAKSRTGRTGRTERGRFPADVAGMEMSRRETKTRRRMA